MFHIFSGNIVVHDKQAYLQNDVFGIQISYLGRKTHGQFFLYPYIDDNKKTIFYFAFDTSNQKKMFEDLLKISGIGPKTAFQIVQLPLDSLQNAITNLDVKFFQAIPGIGPKSAKKILLELKGSFNIQEMNTIDENQKFYKDIIKSLKNFGYDAEKIKAVLQGYEGVMTKETISDVVKRVIGKI